MTHESAVKPNKILAVEGVRGIASFMVVLAHLVLFFFPPLYTGASEIADHNIQLWLRNSPFTFFFSGLSAVYIFFALSGYVLTAVALKPGRPLVRILSMSLKRYPRLMIPAMVSCILAFILLSLGDISHPALSGPFKDVRNFDYTFGGALFSGAIDSFVLSGRSLYNPVLWTMKIELIGSFLVYMLCINSVVLKSRMLPVVILSVISILVLTRSIEDRFGLGLICFIGGHLFQIYGRSISTPASIVMMVVGLYLAGAQNDSALYAWITIFLGTKTYGICNFISGFLIVYAVIFSAKINDVFSHPIPVFMGKVSFSVYLIHFPIIVTFGVCLFGTVYGILASYEMAALLTSCLITVFIYALSVPFYKYVDANGMELSNYISERIIKRTGLENRFASRTRL